MVSDSYFKGSIPKEETPRKISLKLRRVDLHHNRLVRMDQDYKHAIVKHHIRDSAVQLSVHKNLFKKQTIVRVRSTFYRIQFHQDKFYPPSPQYLQVQTSSYLHIPKLYLRLKL